MNSFGVAACKWNKMWFYFSGGPLELSVDSTGSKIIEVIAELPSKNKT